MSIDAMYPSRSQSRWQNPLFSRALRRRQLGLMLALIFIGIGMVLVQLIPITAHADAKAVEMKPAIPAVSPVKPMSPVSKTIRQIPIYGPTN